MRYYQVNTFKGFKGFKQKFLIEDIIYPVVIADRTAGWCLVNCSINKIIYTLVWDIQNKRFYDSDIYKKLIRNEFELLAKCHQWMYSLHDIS